MSRERDILKLGNYIDAFLARRTDLAQETKATFAQVKREATAYFGGNQSMYSITPGDAKDYVRKLSERLAVATVAMHVKKLRQLWADAMDRRLLKDNPWKSMKAGTQVNPARQQYIPVADVARVIAACPDTEWQAAFALARFAGLRVPSELRGLRWADIDFEAGRMLVHSPKTRRHVGKDKRWVPLMRGIFPQLESTLRWAQANGDEPYVLPRLRLHTNLAVPARAILERAGVTRWGRFWNNLRSSCETDLARALPIHTACMFIGNSAGVAMRHYIQLCDSDFDLANKPKADTKKSVSNVPKTVAKTSETVTLNAFPTGLVNKSDSLGELQQIHNVMQRVLHDRKGELAAFRRRSIRSLRMAVRHAKRRALLASARRGRLK